MCLARVLMVGVLLCIPVASAVTTWADTVIETVPVGNVGNAPDYTGFGSVGYAYNIGKYEVTAGQYTEFLNAVAGVDTHALYNTNMSRTDYGCGITRSGGGTIETPYTYSAAADFVNRPVNYVCFWDAVRFVNWLHNGQGNGDTESGAYADFGNTFDFAREPGAKYALPTPDEWYKAAYHKNDGVTGNYFAYPTASDTAPGQDRADVSGNNANYWTAPYVYPIDSGKYTTLVGEFQNSDSPYGTFDQGGNVAEWNEWYTPAQLRGGSYEQPEHLLTAESFQTGWDLYEGGYVGFRVVAVPEPGSVVLGSLGVIGLLTYVWRRRWVGRNPCAPAN